MGWRAKFILMAALVDLAGLAGCGQPAPSSRNPSTLHTVAGYLVPEDARGITALDAGVLTEISPVWYYPTVSGQLAFASDAAQQSLPDIEAQAISHRVAVLPSISNFVGQQWDGELIHRMLSDPQTRAAHIAAIVDLVQSHKWAGIDLDYESLLTADRTTYSAFVRDLANSLHRVQKRLTLAVHAKTVEPGDWSGAQAEDWQALGQAADEVRLMTYDYSTPDSPPGPIAPIAWVESVLRLAVSEIPRDKVILGVATYGYDWSSGQQGQDVQWTDAQAISQAHGAQVKWDPTSESPWFAYTDAHGRSHTVWYENAHSLNAKFDLARQSGVGGIFVWRLGGEAPAIWSELQ